MNSYTSSSSSPCSKSSLGTLAVILLLLGGGGGALPPPPAARADATETVAPSSQRSTRGVGGDGDGVGGGVGGGFDSSSSSFSSHRLPSSFSSSAADLDLYLDRHDDSADAAAASASTSASASWASSRRLRSELTLDEKISLLHGVPGSYVGNVPPLPSHGIPPLNMNDGPQGFRSSKDRPGTSTSWPCGLNLASTFDVDLTRRYGEALAEEFKDKGSNVVLGPGLNVARVPLNGRNFEYLSGEDPALGSELAAAYVGGVQSVPGIMACAKHYVHNNQETDRTTVNEVVDLRTHWEIYMGPFEAAVRRGGLSSVMCSYNKVNGKYACENEDVLNGDLKGTLGFRGFVVSDWEATHSDVDAALAGLDVEMPGGRYFGDKLKQAVMDGKVNVSVVDDKVDRVLYALYESGSMSHPPRGDGAADANVTREGHSRLAREIAAAGTILLKNGHNGSAVLPLSKDDECNIAVVGDMIPSGFGSGHVVGPYVVSGYDGIGTKCSDSAGGKVTYSNMTDVGGAASAVEAADVAVIFTSTSSGEGTDRPNASLPDVELQMIHKIISIANSSRKKKNIIVVVTSPGSILLPFSSSPSVSAILLTFLPGQECGNAVADVLFGDVDPGGRLPITLPNVENEVGLTPEQWPGVNGTATYTERLSVGYRWYDANNVKPRYPFGFGLSYTKFVYSNIRINFDDDYHVRDVDRQGRRVWMRGKHPLRLDGDRGLDLVGFVATISFDVANAGNRDGYEVPQLYLSFPPEAGEPPRVLRRFTKVYIKAGENVTVTFSLEERDLSVFVVGGGGNDGEGEEGKGGGDGEGGITGARSSTPAEANEGLDAIEGGDRISTATAARNNRSRSPPGGRWEVVQGLFVAYVGPSSADLPLHVDIVVDDVDKKKRPTDIADGIVVAAAKKARR